MTSLSKREWFFIIAIVVGLILGKLIKRITLGMALGLLLAFIAVMIFSNKKKSHLKYIRMSPVENEQIPFFKKWRHWYWLVICFQILLAVLFYLFTKHYA